MADMPFVPLSLRSDEDLGAALRSMGGDVAWPAAVPVAGGPDVASLVRARLVRDGADTTRGAGRSRWARWSPARRALVLAIVALLALAAVAAAAGIGLPGLRIIFGGPSAAPPSPSATLVPSAGSATAASSQSARPTGTSRPTATPRPTGLGSRMSLGDQVPLAELDARAQFPVRMPADPSIGPPDSAWVNPELSDQVSLIWGVSDRLPPTEEPNVGLVLTAFRGTVSDGWFSKSIGAGTTVEPVRVGDKPGYWVSGESHVFFYEGPNGFVDDSRRLVGDVLLWADGPITYRLETSLGRDAAIAIAETLQ